MRSPNKISKNVTYTEATKSNTATKYSIDNTPNQEQLDNMKYVSKNVFEKVRKKFRVPIAVTSFFRSEKLNKKIGGVTSSQHLTGEAMDLDADVFGLVTNREIFDYIYENLDYDQLIWEYGDSKEPAWVHVSLKQCEPNRKETLRVYNDNGVVKWMNYEV